MTKKKERMANESTYESTRANLGAQVEKNIKFNGQQGHGFAAENANHYIDNLKGRKAILAGENNAKNGPDRIVNGQQIQTKYCMNAKQSVNAGFNHEGKYRYLDPNGKPMQIEVPKDQYQEAVRIMEEKIKAGKVPGVTDPKEAKKLVREGQVTYRQAINISKFGTVESLIYDAAHGTVVATNAMGISSAVVFAKAIIDGEDFEEAIETAIASGLKAGGAAFATSVIAGQLSRTQYVAFLKAPVESVVKILPPQVRHLLVNSLRNGAPIYGAAATKNLAKLLRGNVVAATATMIVTTGPDVIDAFRGRISAGQLFKNATVAAGGIAGGVLGGMAAGAVVGSVVPGIGNVAGAVVGLIGGVLGGLGGGEVTKAVMDEIIEDDAEEMQRIFNESFVSLAEDYLLNTQEATEVGNKLPEVMTSSKWKDMYAANSRYVFAENILEPIIESVVKKRPKIEMPEGVELIDGMERLLVKAENI